MQCCSQCVGRWGQLSRGKARLEGPPEAYSELLLANTPAARKREIATTMKQHWGVLLKLDPLSRSESSAYVRHRIARTHIDGQFEFTEAALTGLHWRTSGVPRRINLAGERALFLACGEKTRRVTLGMVWSACNEFSKVWK